MTRHSRGSLALLQIQTFIVNLRQNMPEPMELTARRIGMTNHSQLSRILAGKGGLSLGQAERIANFLGMSLESLLGKGRELMERGDGLK